MLIKNLASHAGVFRGARFSSLVFLPGEGRNTSSPKNACVGGYEKPSYSLVTATKPQMIKTCLYNTNLPYSYTRMTKDRLENDSQSYFTWNLLLRA